MKNIIQAFFLQAFVLFLTIQYAVSQSILVDFNYTEKISQSEHNRLSPTGIVVGLDNYLLQARVEHTVVFSSADYDALIQINNTYEQEVQLQIKIENESYSHALLPGLNTFGPYKAATWQLIAGHDLELVQVFILERRWDQTHFNNSGSCNVNVNCPEGNAWQEQKRSVVKLLIPISGFLFDCTGVMVNNTAQDYTPYLLTAEHCFDFANAFENPSVLNQLVARFHYDALGCSNPTAPAQIPFFNRTGVDFVARSADGGGDFGSDFQLLKLKQNLNATQNVFFAGWDIRNVASPSGASLHHPSGDIKKISTYNQPLVSTAWGNSVSGTHWEVRWIATTNGHGVTEGGSSGSPIFSNEGLITGTLTGGFSDCSFRFDEDLYGKMWYHWDKNGTAANRQLKPHLDPNNSGLQTLSGQMLSNETRALMPKSQVLLYPNPSRGSIQLEVEPHVFDQAVIYSVSGQKLVEYKLASTERIQHLSPTLKPGVYWIQLSGTATWQNSLQILE